MLTEAQIKALLLVAAVLLVLAVVAVGLALAAQDDAEERQVLDAVGAPPRTIRRVTARQAGLLALHRGAHRGARRPAAGGDHRRGTDIRVPVADWALRPDVPGLLLVLVIVPVAAGLVTWVGGRLRAIVRTAPPRRVRLRRLTGQLPSRRG